MFIQMFFDDDLPVWGFIGKTEQKTSTAGQHQLHFYLFTHFHFDIAYNEDRVIELNVSTAALDPKKTIDITSDNSLEVEFSYSVKWKPTSIPFDDRMDRYTRYSFLPQHLEVRGWVGLVAGLAAPSCVCSRHRSGPGYSCSGCT